LLTGSSNLNVLLGLTGSPSTTRFIPNLNTFTQPIIPATFRAKGPGRRLHPSQDRVPFVHPHPQLPQCYDANVCVGQRVSRRGLLIPVVLVVGVWRGLNRVRQGETGSGCKCLRANESAFRLKRGILLMQHACIRCLRNA